MIKRYVWFPSHPLPAQVLGLLFFESILTHNARLGEWAPSSWGTLCSSFLGPTPATPSWSTFPRRRLSFTGMPQVTRLPPCLSLPWQASQALLTPACRKVEDVVREAVNGELEKGVDIAQTRGWMMFAICLRQAVAHPFLLENMMKRAFKLRHVKDLIEELNAIQLKTPFMVRISRWCEDRLQLARAPGTNGESLAADLDLMPALGPLQKLHEAIKHGLCWRCGTLPEDTPFRPKVRACIVHEFHRPR